MSSDDPKKRPPGAHPPARSHGSSGTGEGARTALEALIRQRKLAETPEETKPEPPAPASP
jgi:hypothetical protein